MRTLNTAGQALLDRLIAGEDIPTVALVYFATTVPVRYAVAGQPFTYAGNTYSAREVIVERVSHSTAMPAPLRVTLPGVTPSEIALAFDDVEGLDFELRLGFVDPATMVVEDAPVIYAGKLDVPTWEAGPTSTVIFHVVHRAEYALRQRATVYTDDEQQRLSSGDTSLRFDHATDGAQIVWPGAGAFNV